jgi:UDP-glucose 4-epimerase
MAAAIECGVTRVTAASSLAVYFGMQSGPFRESMPLLLSAGNPIEANKKIDEVVGAFLTASGALRVVRARIGSIWGPCYHSMMNAPSRLAMRALGRHERIQGRPDPLAAHPDDLMDIFYARDCGRALAALHTRSDPAHDVYNVSAGHMIRYGDLVDAVNRAVPEAKLALTVPDREPIGSPQGYVDTTWLGEDIGFKAEFDLERAMHDYVAWLRENPE